MITVTVDNKTGPREYLTKLVLYISSYILPFSIHQQNHVSISDIIYLAKNHCQIWRVFFSQHIFNYIYINDVF